MLPSQTHELKISLSKQGLSDPALKCKIKDWLILNGHESFVEGVVEGIDIDHDYDDIDRDYYSELGGVSSPLIIYSYHLEDLKLLAEQLVHQFEGFVETSFTVLDTATWSDGWKESFKPIETILFYIRAPWHEAKTGEKIAIEIEPGMAFGTGQHATTQLCLTALESLYFDSHKKPARTVMDVGTGTGILAMAAKKLGAEIVDACDIDPLSISACQENARINDLDLRVWKGSVPLQDGTTSEGCPPYDLVFANILMVVLVKIIEDLSKLLDKGSKLVLSGLLIENEKEMLDLCKKHNLMLYHSCHLDGWSCLTLEKDL